MDSIFLINEELKMSNEIK